LKRFCYRGQYKSDQIKSFFAAAEQSIRQLVRSGSLYTLTVFTCEDNGLFIYGEAVGDVPDAELLFPGLADLVLLWPGCSAPRAVVPMSDVYHSYQPDADEEAAWRACSPAQPHAKISYIKPEMTSSYVFHHYQLQEEQPGANGHHLSIWMSEDLALLYEEFPDKAPAAPHAGKLDTNNTPANWSGCMIPHFEPFSDGQLYHETEIILTVTKGAV